MRGLPGLRGLQGFARAAKATKVARVAKAARTARAAQTAKVWPGLRGPTELPKLLRGLPRGLPGLPGGGREEGRGCGGGRAAGGDGARAGRHGGGGKVGGRQRETPKRPNDGRRRPTVLAFPLIKSSAKVLKHHFLRIVSVSCQARRSVSESASCDKVSGHTACLAWRRAL